MGMKKLQLNEQLYEIHLECTKTVVKFQVSVTVHH